MLSERCERLQMDRFFFSTFIRVRSLAISSTRLVQVHALARHAWLHSNHMPQSFLLSVQCERTLTALVCALPAGSCGCRSPNIAMYEEMREDPRSLDLGAAESDTIFGMDSTASAAACDKDI